MSQLEASEYSASEYSASADLVPGDLSSEVPIEADSALGVGVY